MKPFFFILLAFPLLSQAQLTKGTWFTGGSASFNDQNFQGGISGSTNATTFSVSPSLGYMVSDRWAIGGTLGYGLTHQTEAPYTQTDNLGQPYAVVNDTYKSNSFSSGIFARRFFAISDKFLFTLVGSVNFQRVTTTFTTNSTPIGGGSAVVDRENSPFYTLGASVRPLFIFFPSPKWGLEAGLGSISYTHVHDRYNNGGMTGENTVSIAASSSTTFGHLLLFQP